MLYSDNICLADDRIYTYEYCTYQYEINRYPRALQSVTTDFYAYRLFNRSSRMVALEVAHLELSGHRPTRSTLSY